MSEYISVANLTHPECPSLHVQICDDFSSRLAGLMFRKSLPRQEAIALCYSRESKLDTSIHMFFMNFDIAVFWLDNQHKIVDKILAKKWKPFYASTRPSSIVIEAHPDRLNDYQINDLLQFNTCEK